jgi:hypothetical protein
MPARIRETPWCNPYWRHFEAKNGRGEVTTEVSLSQGGRMIVTKHRMGGLFTTKKEYQVDGDIPGMVSKFLK